jgi:hypothetical protein
MPDFRFPRRSAAAGLAGLIIAAGAFALPCSAASPLVSRSKSETSLVTVRSVDLATRHMVIANSKGETVSVKVPPEIKRLEAIKPGDKIRASYTAEVVISLATGNALPLDRASADSVRTVSGGPPSAGMATHVTVTGAVLAIDMAKHTIKLVSPKGGEVHTVEVATAEGRKAMSKLKVGDKITASVTESLLVGVQPS